MNPGAQAPPRHVTTTFSPRQCSGRRYRDSIVGGRCTGRRPLPPWWSPSRGAHHGGAGHRGSGGMRLGRSQSRSGARPFYVCRDRGRTASGPMAGGQTTSLCKFVVMVMIETSFLMLAAATSIGNSTPKGIITTPVSIALKFSASAQVVRCLDTRVGHDRHTRRLRCHDVGMGAGTSSTRLQRIRGLFG